MFFYYLWYQIDIRSIKIRNQKREELAQDSVFIAPLFGPQPEQGGGDMGMGM